MPRVTFSENEVASVQTYQRLDWEHAQELFYQPEDYIQFRAEYRAFKAQKARKERLARMTYMTAQARNELQNRNQLKMTVLPPSSLNQQPMRRQPRQPRGFALMA
ncbi:expressed unknown protein [Seminavis robusta]|uniref:Uncharacterized protein n=1 Tax=Seminavis robusta TaxID=568900 RepID=A0A9N8H7H1_9STRA|nr:expressed unknown protein [Seminavis robusta]|eukprot:Sro204_g085870.1 n/a (105) ;mRNA; r:35493-35807